MELVFDLAPKSVSVVLSGVKYTLRGADAAAGAHYNNMRLAGARMDDGKIVGMTGVGSLEPELVAMCLFTEDGKSIALATVQSWPYGVVSALFNEVKRMSPELDGVDTEASIKAKIDLLERKRALLKNAGSATTGTSV